MSDTMSRSARDSAPSRAQDRSALGVVRPCAPQWWSWMLPRAMQSLAAVRSAGQMALCAGQDESIVVLGDMNRSVLCDMSTV